MQSNNNRRMLNGRALAAGFAGVLVGALVIGFMPSASEEAESGVVLQNNSHANNAITVTLYLRRGANKTLTLRGCHARQTNTTAPGSPCAAEPEDKNDLPERVWSAQAAIEWNGTNNSGCVIVGGVRYCW